MNKVKIVFNKLLGGWYVVRGAHQTPLSGRFDTRAQAKAWLDRKFNCDKCGRPNPNHAWANYCPACREGWQKQHDEIERFWAKRSA